MLMHNIIVSETVGTALLILLGNGVVASCCLKETKSGAAGWMVITTAWAFAVYVAVLVAGPYSGAHLNPAVTFGLAVAGNVAWNVVPNYLLGEMLGAAMGAFLVWVLFYDHFQRTDDEGAKRACFCTEPAIRNLPINFINELVGTFVLVFAVFFIVDGSFVLPESQHPVRMGLGSIGALPVAIIVWSIGLSLGATTGYAINPARDLAPRIVLALLPLRVNPDWGYSWIPVFAPLAGGGLAALAFKALM